MQYGAGFGGKIKLSMTITNPFGGEGSVQMSVPKEKPKLTKAPSGNKKGGLPLKMILLATGGAALAALAKMKRS